MSTTIDDSAQEQAASRALVEVCTTIRCRAYDTIRLASESQSLMRAAGYRSLEHCALESIKSAEAQIRRLIAEHERRWGIR